MVVALRKCVLTLITVVLCLSMTGCATLDAGKYYKEGTDFMSGNEFDKAAECFNNAIASNPDRAEYYIDCAFAYIELHDYEKASALFDKAYLEKNNQVVRENNKKVLRGKGIMYYEQGLYAEAAECFDSALLINELGSINTDIEKYLGATYMKMAQYDEALEMFNKVLDVKKSDASAYASRAAAYSQLGDTDMAAKDYDNAIALDPSTFSYYIGKYNIYIASGNEAEAKKVLDATYALKTKTKEDYFNLAVVHYLCGDLASAESELMVSAGDGYYESYYYLGNICVNRGEYDSALKYYELYTEGEGEPSYATYYDGMSECLIHTGDYNRALGMVNKGLELGTEESRRNLLFKKVSVLEKMQDYAGAKDAASEYVKRYPGDTKMEDELFLLKEITDGIV